MSGKKTGHVVDGKIVMDELPRNCNAQAEWEHKFQECISKHGGMPGTDDVRSACKREIAVPHAVLKQVEPHIPMILLADQRQVTSDICHADANIRRQCSVAELLERLKVMCTRKRAQKKRHIAAGPVRSARG